METRVEVRQITFKNHRLNVVIIKDVIEHVSACCNKHEIVFYRKGQIVSHSWKDKDDASGHVVYDDVWELKKQKVYEPIYDEFINLADKLF